MASKKCWIAGLLIGLGAGLIISIFLMACFHDLANHTSNDSYHCPFILLIIILIETLIGLAIGIIYGKINTKIVRGKKSNSRSQFLSKNNLLNSKRSQQEIVGFVLIVVIVMIMFLIYLSFSISRGANSRENSVEISDLLGASMYYTTNCTISYGQPSSLQDIIRACYRDNEICDDGTSPCEIMNKTFREEISNILNIKSSQNKAYNLSIYYQVTNSTARQNPVVISEGSFTNCSSKPGGIQMINLNTGSNGMIDVELEVCRK